MRRMLAAGLVLGAVMAGLGVVHAMSAEAAAVPAHHPTRLAHVADARQLIVVVGNAKTSTYSTVYTYQKSGSTWKAAFAAMPARNGYAGWVWGKDRIQDTGRTPMGTYRISSTFGLKADPGTKMSYKHADANDYWVGDNRDGKTYNMFQPSASAKRTWRVGQAERLASYPTQYEYAAIINYNRPAADSVRWNATRGQYETSKPANLKRGSAIFLHINGRGSTAGCVSLRRADLIRVLKWLDPARKPRIVMATKADIGRA